ncbi:uncharacterized protein N7487_006948 [Penicillium crustosum]|uniref:uncharacterized protein n=1 Tax=Penicillium crustosum TaxID=36656 RepID=UPI00239783B2|nr:uncharacterized protein N7487_006948 [Penicillium crustosum]KAJ5412589.1 hypothetical protein N7487_006948 [Penicillium crustosum]
MVDQLTKRKPGMIVRASSIKIVSTAMGMAIQDPDARNRDSSQQDKVCGHDSPGRGGDVILDVCRELSPKQHLRLVEEIDHEYNFVLDGVAGGQPNDDNFLEKSRNGHLFWSILVPCVFGDAASEDEVSDEVEDGDDVQVLIFV